MEKFLITGGAGYIGSHMALLLLNQGNEVKVLDKLPLEEASRLKPVLDNSNFSYCQIDLSEQGKISYEFKDFKTIIHLAASADISLGFKQSDLDLKQGTLLTYSVLEAMRRSGVKEIIFSSSGTVYGYPFKIPTPEDSGMILPISLYGASKLASESLISAFCYFYDMQSWIFRFGNIIGKDSTRGVIYDLVTKIQSNKSELEVLGDGEQLKDYVYLDDCMEAMLKAHNEANERVNVFNIGSDSNISVKEVVRIILEEMNLENVKIRYSGGPRGWLGGGWPGDIAKVLFDISKLKKLGWKPKFNSKEAVTKAVQETLQNFA